MSAISHYGLVTPFRPSLKVAYFDHERLRTWCGVCRHPKPDDTDDDVGLNQTLESLTAQKCLFEALSISSTPIIVSARNGPHRPMRHSLFFMCSSCHMSRLVNDASDSKRCAGCKEDVELERNTQGPQDGAGNHQTWLNARRDPFILKFPPEISSLIFLLSMDTQSHDDLGKLPTPFLLGSVCRGWRLLARSTPELWSTVSFRLGKPPRKPEGLSQLQAVSGWLQLSGDVSLTLHVFKYWGADSISQEGCGPVIDILNQHSERWEKILLYIPASFSPRLCGTSSPSRLCDLHVIGDHYDRAPTFKMRSRPSPSHLTISHFHISTFDINWDNLTFLRMTLSAFDGCIEAIQQAPLLEMCSITLYWIEILPSIPKITVRHTRLRTLKLFRVPVELLYDFLDVLELPSLQAYHQQTLNHDIYMENLISFLNRSGMDLKQLSLDVSSLRKEDIEKLLTAVPSLQTLQLDFWCTENAFVIRGLFENVSSSPPVLGGGPGFLPSLQSLTISGRGISMWECIPRLFYSSHRKILPLEVNKTGEIETDTLRKIPRLIAEGFDI